MGKIRLLGAALFTVLISCSAFGVNDVTFAVWSDTHFGAYDFADTTRLDIVDQINNLRDAAVPKGFAGTAAVDVLIHCGDITENGSAKQWHDPNAPQQQSYVRTIARLDSRIKTYAALGNHDSRKNANIRPAFAALHGGTYYSFDCKGVHFAVLDPYSEMNTAAPSLDQAQLEWLAADLERLSPQTPVIIVMHILPVFDETIDRTSRLNRASSDALAGVIEGKNVLAFLHGHWHARSVKDWNGIPVIAPAGFAYYRKGCAGGHPCLGIIQVTDSAFSVYGYNWEVHTFDEKPLYRKDFSAAK